MAAPLIAPYEAHKRRISMKPLLAALTLSYRLFFGLAIRTMFVPDEYFQTIEPVFFYTNQTTEQTWEWREDFRMRSCMSLLLYLPTLWAGRSYRLGGFVLLLSRVMQSILAAIGDFGLYSLVISLTLSDTIAFGILLTHLFSWSYSYCICRTLVNSTEASLLLVTLFIWYRGLSSIGRPTELKSSLYRSSALILATVIVWSRPSATLFWTPFTLWHAARVGRSSSFIVNTCIPLGTVVSAFYILLDSYFYGAWTITPYNFFKFNIAKNYAEIYYGAKPFHWNFSNGLPVMLGLYLPLLLYSWLYVPQHREIHRLNVLAVVYVVVLSGVTRHQEYRFLLPVMPLFHMSIGYLVAEVMQWGNQSRSAVVSVTEMPVSNGDDSDCRCLMLDYLTSGWIRRRVKVGKGVVETTADLDQLRNLASEPNEQASFQNPMFGRVHTMIPRIIIILIFALNFALALYLSTRHQSGAESSYRFLSGEFQSLAAERADKTTVSAVKVLLLAPCHSFPGYSALLHPKINLTLDALDCSPDRRVFEYQYPSDSRSGATPNGASNECEATDINSNVPLKSEVASPLLLTESQVFDKSPAAFIDAEGDYWIRRGRGADFILTFDAYMDDLYPLLKDRGYRQVAEFHHADFRYDLDDPKPKRKVHVLRRRMNEDDTPGININQDSVAATASVDSCCMT